MTTYWVSSMYLLDGIRYMSDQEKFESSALVAIDMLIPENLSPSTEIDYDEQTITSHMAISASTGSEAKHAAHVQFMSAFDSVTFNTPIRLLFQTVEDWDDDEEDGDEDGTLDAIFAEAELFADASSDFHPELN